MTKIVIVGGGHAAGQVAASLRQGKFDGDIVMLAAESDPPYQRPPLSKDYLAGQNSREDLYLRKPEFYAREKIDLRTACPVAAVDRAAKTVATVAGDTVGYDKLVLATGSRARTLDAPGAGLDGVFYLRTLDDADKIRTHFSRGKRLCIVGGGYIGLEVASSAVAAGLDVTLVEREKRILYRVATPQLSDFYTQLHRDHGVGIRVAVEVRAFEGDGSVTAVCCADDRIAADLVIVGIGILPNIELAQAAGLDCADGIVVDARCRTSDRDIYAAGDCTNHPCEPLGRRLRLESVPNAIDQARVVAANLTGGDKTYATVPWFWSDQYGLKLQMVGFATDGDQSVTRGDPASRRFAVFHLQAGRLVAVDAVDDPQSFIIGRKHFGQVVDPLRLADPETDLKVVFG